MKTTRILSLLFSVSQFILVLKLIEYVRGEETELGFKNRQPKHFFVAPGIQKRKKNKPWLTTSSTTEESISATDTSRNSSELGIDEYKFQRKILNETLSSNITRRNDSKIQLGRIEKIGVAKQENTNNSSQTPTLSASNVPNDNTGRLCPTCANGGCDGNVSGSSFPIIPIVVAVVAAVIWFFVFLWIVLGSKKDDDTTEGYGYGGGNLGGSLPSITYNNNMARSINDFLRSEEIGRLTKFVLNAFDKFS